MVHIAHYAVLIWTKKRAEDIWMLSCHISQGSAEKQNQWAISLDTDDIDIDIALS